MTGTRMVFVGEAWRGSCARSLREALVRGGQEVEEVAEDGIAPHWRSLAGRLALRALSRVVCHEVDREIRERVAAAGAGLLVVYKGTHVGAGALRQAGRAGVFTVNVFPDASPLRYGARLREALGAYDLVVSTKVWHPAAWHGTFGYTNACDFVAQGYDPTLHLVRDGWETGGDELDVVLVATYRAEYEQHLREAAEVVPFRGLRVGVFGNGWAAARARLPGSWVFPGAVSGEAYVRALRSGRCALAPVTRDMVVDGRRFPGDDDTTRTYEIPAAGVAMVHRRTALVRELFADGEEILTFGDGREMAEQALRLVHDAGLRRRLREAAYRRAVPRYSLDARAQEVMEAIHRRSGTSR